MSASDRFSEAHCGGRLFIEIGSISLTIPIAVSAASIRLLLDLSMSSLARQLEHRVFGLLRSLPEAAILFRRSHHEARGVSGEPQSRWQVAVVDGVRCVSLIPVDAQQLSLVDVVLLVCLANRAIAQFLQLNRLRRGSARAETQQRQDR